MYQSSTARLMYPKCTNPQQPSAPIFAATYECLAIIEFSTREPPAEG